MRRRTLVVPLVSERTKVEKLLGGGATVPRRRRTSSGREYVLERVAYASSALTILYVQPRGKPEVVFGVFTPNPRYHTRDGLRVGSTLSAARHADGIRCSPQLGTRFACEGGLGFEKPVSAFYVIDGRVVRFGLVAVAD
jgi:hypothetical protein